jgi:macrolide-specific efflux system membrane fusion protein
MFHYRNIMWKNAESESSSAPVTTTEVAAPPKVKPATRPGRRRKPVVRSLILLIFLAVAAGAGWWFYLRPQSVVAPPTVAVARGDVQETVLATGILEASSLVSVGAQVSGRIEKLDVKLGDVVKTGDVLAEIDSHDQQNAVNSAQAALAMAQAQLRSQQATVKQAQASLDRNNQMAAKGIVATADLETAQAAVATAEAQVDVINAQIQQANINVATAQLNLSRTKVTAPMDGTVVSLLVDEGQTVNAVQSSPTIVKLADLTNMVIKAQISEADVPHVKPGQPVYFTILGEPDKRINASLLTIDPAPDSIATESDTTTPSTTTAIYYNGLFQVPNPDGKLRIDMTAAVTVVLQDAKNALTVPSAAVHKSPRGNGSVVQVYDPTTGKVDFKRVTVGINNNVTAEITDGLNEGDLVVTSGGRGGGRGAGAGKGANGQTTPGQGRQRGGLGGVGGPGAGGLPLGL